MADLNARMILQLVDQFTGPARHVTRSLRAMTRAAKNLSASLGQASGAASRSRRQLRGLAANLGGGLGATGRGAAGGRRGRGRDPALLEAGRSSLIASGLHTVGTEMQRLGRTGRRAISGMFGVAFNFEQQMANTRSVVGNITDQEFTQLNAKARELGETTKFTAGQVGEAMFFLGQSGMEANQVFASVGDTLNLAAAGSLQLGQASDIATDILAAMRLPTESLGRAVDVLANTAANSNTSVAQLGTAFKRVGPIAAAAGISIEEVTAIVGTFANAGLKGGLAGRGLRAVLGSLAKPSERSAARLKKLGIDIEDASGNMKRPVQLFAELAESLRGVPTGQRMKDLFQIFGRVGAPAIEAAIAQFDKTGVGANKMLELLASNMNAAGRAAEIARIRMDTGSGATLRLKSAWEGLILAVTDFVKGPGREILENLAGIVRKLTAWAKQNPDMIKATIKWGAALTVVTTVLGPLISGAGTMLMLTTQLRTAMMLQTIATQGVAAASGAAAAKVGLLSAGIAGPLGIAALAGGAAYAFGSWADQAFRLSDALAGVNQQKTKRGAPKVSVMGDRGLFSKTEIAQQKSTSRSELEAIKEQAARVKEARRIEREAPRTGMGIAEARRGVTLREEENRLKDLVAAREIREEELKAEEESRRAAQAARPLFGGAAAEGAVPRTVGEAISAIEATQTAVPGRHRDPRTGRMMGLKDAPTFESMARAVQGLTDLLSTKGLGTLQLQIVSEPGEAARFRVAGIKEGGADVKLLGLQGATP